MIPSALIYIIAGLFCLGALAAFFAWATGRWPDDYEPIENGGDDE